MHWIFRPRASADRLNKKVPRSVKYDSVLAIRKQALREYCLLAGSIMRRAIQGMSLLRDNYKEYENTGELRRSGRRVFIQYLLRSRYVLYVWIPAWITQYFENHSFILSTHFNFKKHFWIISAHRPAMISKIANNY